MIHTIKYITTVFFTCAVVSAQVGIGTNDPKSTLDVSLPATYTSGTPAGVSMPRATADQIESMTTTTLPDGTIIWSTTATGTTVNAIGYWYWSGSAWTSLSGGGGGTADGDGIYSADNTITTARNVTLGNGDLSFTGDVLAEGNDVIIGANSALRTQGARFKAIRLEGGTATLGQKNVLNSDEVYVLNSTSASGNVDMRLPDPAMNEGRVVTFVNNAAAGATIDFNDIIVGGSATPINSTNFDGINAGHQIRTGEVYTFLATNGKWYLESTNVRRVNRKTSPNYITGTNYTVKLEDDVVLLEATAEVTLTLPTCTEALYGKRYTIIRQFGTYSTPFGVVVTNPSSGNPVQPNQGKDIMCIPYGGTEKHWKWIGQF